ncbi:MAG TPA: MBL fold metallo-hydrolase, partial [Burkholderiaceae bacterium]|nr:MBL fold metallo-hydrolase [Burkholderiaceae bacterium]
MINSQHWPHRLRKAVLLLAVFLAASGLLASTGCAMNPHYDKSRTHHTPEGFRNVPATTAHDGFWRWKWDQWWDDLPKPPANGYAFPVLQVDSAYLAANAGEVTLTWIGHATLLLQLGGVNILVDPMFSERASPLSFAGPKRKVPPAMALGDLPPIHIVLISHNHYDHLDLASVRALANQPSGAPRFFVPLGIKAWFADNVFNGADASKDALERVVEQDWWEHTELLGLQVHQVPAQHFSARTPFDRNEVLWGGFVVEHPAFRFFWAGDTGYGPHFREIGRRFGPIDLAALPIGAYEPRWFMGPVHINPAEAVQAHEDLGARQSVGVHWGTF